RGGGLRKRAEGEVDRKDWRGPGIIEGGELPGPRAPAPSKRPGHLRGGHGCRRRRSPPLRSGQRTRRDQAGADRRELEEQRGQASFDDLPHFRALIDDGPSPHHWILTAIPRLNSGHAVPPHANTPWRATSKRKEAGAPVGTSVSDARPTGSAPWAPSTGTCSLQLSGRASRLPWQPRRDVPGC